MKFPSRQEIYQLGKEKGFWENKLSKEEVLASIHGEVSEACQSFKYGDSREKLMSEFADIYLWCESANEAYKQGDIYHDFNEEIDIENIRKICGYLHKIIEDKSMSFEQMLTFVKYFLIAKFGQELSNSVVKKHEINKTREYLHGVKF